MTIAHMVDTSDEWIYAYRNQVRHITTDNETTAHLATEAGKRRWVRRGQPEGTRPDHRRDDHAGNAVPFDRLLCPGSSRRQERLGVRPGRRLQWFRLRPAHRPAVHGERTDQQSTGHRSRNTDQDHQLAGSVQLYPLRRRGRSECSRADRGRGIMYSTLSTRWGVLGIALPGPRLAPRPWRIERSLCRSRDAGLSSEQFSASSSVTDGLNHCKLTWTTSRWWCPTDESDHRVAAKRLNLPDEKVFVNAQWQHLGRLGPIAFTECIEQGAFGRGCSSSWPGARRDQGLRREF